MASFVLALDVGTSSVRAILQTAEGVTQRAALPHTEVPIAHTVTATPDVGAELDPELLFAETLQVIDGALAHAQHDATIVGVALSTLWHSVLGVDESGAAITPLYTWADTRAGGAATQLRMRLDEAAVHARTGCVLHPSYLPARLLWLAQTRPQVWQRVARWLSLRGVPAPAPLRPRGLLRLHGLGDRAAQRASLHLGRGDARGYRARFGVPVAPERCRRCAPGAATRVVDALAGAHRRALVPGHRRWGLQQRRTSQSNG